MRNSTNLPDNSERRRLITDGIKAGLGLFIGGGIIAVAAEAAAKLGIPDRIRAGPHTGIQEPTGEIHDDRDLICWKIGSSKYGDTIENPVVKTGPFAGTKVRIYDKKYRGNYVMIDFEDPNNTKQRWTADVKRGEKCFKFTRYEACCQ